MAAKRKFRFNGEPKKINHESTKGRKHEKKNETIFVLSKFRVFAINFLKKYKEFLAKTTGSTTKERIV
ncbi:hypothetical protein D1AOALGA4SA_4724 [Olavius algarvensis Delta 1 endosymbiont]|nr:hypothetical protein D1AOALGA4SA_4724 [Olavius algarvensis Delta 1 endosymbiont]